MKRLVAALIIAFTVLAVPTTANAANSPSPSPDVPSDPTPTPEEPKPEEPDPDIPEEVIEKYGSILGMTDDGNFYVEDSEGNILIVDEHGKVLGVVKSRSGRTSPKTGEFPFEAGFSAIAILSAAGIALTLKKENN